MRSGGGSLTARRTEPRQSVAFSTARYRGSRLATTIIIRSFRRWDTVVILTEMIHNVRVIPLDGRPPIEQGIRLWNGDSRGHWDGDTLVVETTNFSDKTNFRGSGASLHLMERFTRVDADTIDWRFTVDDPTTWERSWTAVLPFTKVPGPIFEYACHEGNYGLVNLLAVARAQEKAAEAAKKR